MPNTLVHLGVQGVASKALMRAADVKWIYLGAIVPDIPWIFQRAVRAFASDSIAYDLRLYVIVQSSLFFCLLLSVALACFAQRPWRIFALLALGSLLHLLLDACETKWGNGVILFAPLSWGLMNFGFFWPESLPIAVLTAFGFVFFIYAWWRFPVVALDVALPRGRAGLLSVAAIVAYTLLPAALLSAPKTADNHFIGTLMERGERPGKTIEFDRVVYLQRVGRDVLVTWAGEELYVAGRRHDASGHVSIRGRFVDPRTVLIEELHPHRVRLRAWASYLGLTLVLLAWIRAARPLDRRRRALR